MVSLILIFTFTAYAVRVSRSWVALHYHAIIVIVIIIIFIARIPTTPPCLPQYLDIIPEPSDDEAETIETATTARPSSSSSSTCVVLEESPAVPTPPLLGLDSARCIFDHFYRASYASAVLAVIGCLTVRPSVRPSVCLSVCHKSELYKDG